MRQIVAEFEFLCEERGAGELHFNRAQGYTALTGFLIEKKRHPQPAGLRNKRQTAAECPGATPVPL